LFLLAVQVRAGSALLCLKTANDPPEHPPSQTTRGRPLAYGASRLVGKEKGNCSDGGVGNTEKKRHLKAPIFFVFKPSGDTMTSTDKLPASDLSPQAFEDPKGSLDSEIPTKPAPKSRAFWLSFVAIMAAEFLSALDLTAVGTALPTIAGALSDTEGDYIWVSGVCLIINAWALIRVER
jgi:hypothetical protein